MNQPLVVGNWKMNATMSQASSLAGAIVQGIAQKAPKAALVLAPPATALATRPAAASISRCGVWAAGWQAVKFGAAGFIVPFFFVYNPALLREMVVQGKLGKKSGEGFYKW